MLGNGSTLPNNTPQRMTTRQSTARASAATAQQAHQSTSNKKPSTEMSALGNQISKNKTVAPRPQNRQQKSAPINNVQKNLPPNMINTHIEDPKLQENDKILIVVVLFCRLIALDKVNK